MKIISGTHINPILVRAMYVTYLVCNEIPYNPEVDKIISQMIKYNTGVRPGVDWILELNKHHLEKMYYALLSANKKKEDCCIKL